MKKFLLPLALVLLSLSVSAQEEQLSLAEQNQKKIEELDLKIGKMGNLKVSGYMQTQWQLAQQDGIAAFADGGSFKAGSDNRFMIRRGRIKFTYTYGIMQMVVQPDFTEKGVGIKDAYLNITSKSKVIGGQMGLFDRPFGYEISYSSSLRETPERSRVFLSLFPGERDLGAMLILNGKDGFTKNFSLRGGLFTGNGVGVETDSKKDFIGRLDYLKKTENAQFGAAFSYYYGGIYNTANVNYSFDKGTGFVEKEGVEGKYSKREYFGVGAQYLQHWGAGTTNIRAEFLWGSQAGTFKTNANPGGSSLGAGTDPIYNRNFNGMYAILVQDLGASKHSLVLKYDLYDPNTKVKGDQIGKLKGTGASDIAFNTYGVGYLFRWNSNIRLMAYYDFVKNEKSLNLSSEDPLKNFSRHIKQNVLTIRAQVKF